eukprot:TRINITY_DN75823_c0_g1_i1.p1 TRINITY_DN75823_c0_g1~~TRINITY_DN75823_c0_g1_i1.p1  ORF type:complete len:226 (-),score=17.04 TRINITY_DN75823_c0_g1_i1:177-812(-)
MATKVERQHPQLVAADETLDTDVEEVVIPTYRIQLRVQELADLMADEYKGKLHDNQCLILVCILKGSFLFTADLARALSHHGVRVQVEFMSISSYGSAQTSSGTVRMLLDLRKDIMGQHVVIVEDIIDSGLTLEYLQTLLRARNPASLKTVVLLNKPERRKSRATVDWVGFEVPDLFVVGYGMDYAEQKRNLPYIGVLKASVYQDTLKAKL